MPPIPEYTAAHSDATMDGFKWVHDSEPVEVLVTRDFDSEVWRVEVWNYAHMTELGPLSKNKSEMRSVAVEWMRNHPEGWSPD